jgi:hypothetical protein
VLGIVRRDGYAIHLFLQLADFKELFFPLHHLPPARQSCHKSPPSRFDFGYARVEQRQKFCPCPVELRDHGNQILFGLLRNPGSGSLQD